MDESRFRGSIRRIRPADVTSNLVVARVRFHSELRHQSDERPELGQSRNFRVFYFAGVFAVSPCIARRSLPDDQRIPQRESTSARSNNLPDRSTCEARCRASHAISASRSEQCIEDAVVIEGEHGSLFSGCVGCVGHDVEVGRSGFTLHNIRAGPADERVFVAIVRVD